MAVNGIPVGRERWSRWFWAILIGITALALALRLHALGQQVLWLDELHSLLNSAAHRGAFEALPLATPLHNPPRFTALTPDSTLAAVWIDMRHDSHPPLYFLFLNTWRQWTGDSEFMLRLPSAVFSALSLIPLALLLREYGQSGSGLAAALLCALAHAHLNLGQQARPYALSGLLLAISFWAVVRLERRGAGQTGEAAAWTSCHALLVLAALLTHYFAALALLGQFPFAILRLRAAGLRLYLLSLASTAALFAVIWLPSMIAQIPFITSQDWVADEAPGHTVRTAVRLLDAPLRLLLERPLHEWSKAWVAIQAAGGLLIVATVIASLRQRSNPAACLLACWAVVPLLALAALDLLSAKQLLTHIRYPIIALPGVAGLLIVAAQGWPARVRYAAAGSLALVIVLTLRLPAIHHPDARQAAMLVATQARPGDLVLFDALDWIPYWTRREFIQVTYYVPRLDCDVAMLNSPPTAELLEDLRRRERIVVVTPRTAEPNHAPETHQAVARSDYIEDIGWVWVFARRPG